MHFNPRTPYGVRRRLVNASLGQLLFQSTHPLRGATQDDAIKVAYSGISIHAPLTGCDMIRILRMMVRLKFQSTHPLRGATTGLRTICLATTNFNPRTPYGVRLLAVSLALPVKDFNPRTPYGVRRNLRVCSLPSLRISIHAPLTGCDSANSTSSSAPGDFNPRTPYGVRLGKEGLFMISFNISIHAPLTGCDTKCGFTKTIISIFQSTHPLRGATGSDYGFYSALVISIHAPLTGCDHLILIRLLNGGYFNPRTPYGVRLVPLQAHPALLVFQSTHPLRGATFRRFSPFRGSRLFQSTHPLRGATAKIHKFLCVLL